MEDLELKQLWQAYDSKLDKLLVLNTQHFEQLKTEKATAKLNAFVRHQVVGIVAGILFSAFLGFLIYHTHNNLWFSISAGAILVATAIATALYVKHVVLIEQIGLHDNIAQAQQKLAAIQASDLQTGRLLILTAPFYTTWFIHPQMIATTGGMLITFGITFVFTVLAIWMYLALAPKNRHKKWVRGFVDSFGGKHITAAMGFLDELQEFKKG